MDNVSWWNLAHMMHSLTPFTSKITAVLWYSSHACFSLQCIVCLSLAVFLTACVRPCSDLAKVQAGLSDKFALLFQWVSTFFAGFAVAFATEWRLTLLLLGMTPFLIVVTGIATKVTKHVW